MKYVLFVCTQNAGRSQIAEALFAKHAPDDLRAESAGAEPADACHPVVVEAMREIGIDLSTGRPKTLTLEMQLHADWAITLACGAKSPYVPSVVEDWQSARDAEGAHRRGGSQLATVWRRAEPSSRRPGPAFR